METDPSVAARPQDDNLLRDIAAQPRPTGGESIARARARCARELRDMGFDVRELRFEYSALPGRFATPLFGAAAAVLVGLAGAWALDQRRFAPATLLATGIALLTLAGRWLARHGVLSIPTLRATGVNLEATLPGDSPAVWLCAHLDSKSQPIPSLVRVAGAVFEGTGIISALVLSLATAAGATMHEFWWGFAGLVTLVGAVPVGLSMVGTRSPGALDNASGVVAVLAAARQLGGHRGVGVLITDAEELGLAGARAWAREARGATVLNCDGVDDGGEFAVQSSGALPERLQNAIPVLPDETVSVTRLLPGLLTDSVAFTDAGHASATFSRGSFASLARVHSVRDNLNNLRGDGIAPMAALLAATARRLT